ncbi:glutathione peroxidase [Nocardioidaceae bacterium]|nr:glutathione peroxidase [Nocardioidaceae bacterium]
MTTLQDFQAPTTSGKQQSLADYEGKVVLVVNTASQCGFTPQLEGLQELYATYRDQGLVVLGFPCNQFGGQAPGTGAEEGEFCQRNYGVEFPVFDRVDVNGEHEHPLFTWLKDEQGGLMGSKIKWNFTKFLIGRDGRVVDRFGSTTKPEKIAKAVQAQL